jgi:hypothetical protein
MGGVTMPKVKIATFNVEWMVSVFAGDWNQWDGAIPDSFPGKHLGRIWLGPIEDVPALCERIAGAIKAIDGADHRNSGRAAAQRADAVVRR